MTAEFDALTVRQVYRFLAHQSFTEIRGIDPNGEKKPVIYFVADEDDFVDRCRQLNGDYNVYVGINPRKQRRGRAEDIASVNAVIIDIDAKRDKKQPATDEELEKAEEVADQIIEWFESQGFHRPIKCMSGNGFQLWAAIPPIELDDENMGEVQRKLQAFQKLIKKKFENDYAEIDNIGDLPRIIKVIGTKSIKGEDTPERPHRLSYAVDPLVRDEDEQLRNYILSLEVEGDVQPANPPKAQVKGELRPCFKQAIEQGWQLTGGDGHHFRLALVAELIAAGYTDQEIHEVFKLQADYDPEITQANIDRTRVKGIRPHRCATIQRDCASLVSQLCDVCKEKRSKEDDKAAEPPNLEALVGELIQNNHTRTINRPIFYHDEVGICYLVPIGGNIEGLHNMPFLSSKPGLGVPLVGRDINKELKPEHGVNTILKPVQFDDSQVYGYLLSCDEVYVADLYLAALRGEVSAFKAKKEDVVMILSTKVSQYVKFNNDYELLTVVFWIIGTYLHPMFAAYPYLIFAGEKSSGKSNALGVIANLAWNPTRKLSLPRETHLFRLTQAYAPTLVIEEYHRIIKNPNVGGDLVALMEVAWERGGRVPRCEGDNHAVVFHEVYTPVALATREAVECEDKGITIVLEKTNDRAYSDAKMRLVNDEPLLREFRKELFRLALTIQFDVKREYESITATERLTGRELILYAPLLAICKTVLPEKYEDYLRWVEDRCEEKRVDQETQEIAILRELIAHRKEIESEGGYYAQITRWLGWENWQTVRSYIRNLQITTTTKNTAKGKRIYFNWDKILTLARDRGIDVEEIEVEGDNNNFIKITHNSGDERA